MVIFAVVFVLDGGDDRATCYVRRSPVTDGVAYPMNGESEGRRAA
jgi:hypothetical protein